MGKGKNISILFIFFYASLCAETGEELFARRIYAHMEIGDYKTACDEAMQALHQYPDSKSLLEAYIRTLAEAGEEKMMMTQWQKFIVNHPEEKNNQELLESLAWAVIKKGAISPSPIIRITALLGALFSKDAKGVALLLSGLEDDNALLRMVAVKLCAILPDASLQEAMLKLFKSEPIWNVRLEAIKSIGKLRILSAQSALEEIILGESYHVEEKAAAVEALVVLSDGIERAQAIRLINSNRAGMRLLACEMIASFRQIKETDLLLPLIQDAHADVRAKVFQVLAGLRVTDISGKNIADLAAEGTADPDPFVAISAARLLILYDQQKGWTTFERFLSHPSREVQYLAAAALASTGKYGTPLMRKIFAYHTNPYVKMNLAIGLIGQRIDVSQASQCLFEGLRQQKEKWEWRHQGPFKVLMPSKVNHDEEIANYPEAVNQLARLEVLEILAIVHHPHVQEAIKNFLKETKWGISGLASALLLTEGDENAVELVSCLLQDSDYKVKVQAALILALWGNGGKAVQVLQDSYDTADRELKGQILEGIGRAGNEASRVFLANKLQEPYQTLRIIAAASLLECLNK